MKRVTREHIIMGLLLAFILLVNVFYLRMKSGYFVDEGMTLFLANGNYNGAVTSRSEGSLGDFLEKFVLKDRLADTVDNLVSMLGELTSAGNYSQEGTVAWYDAARSMLQGQRAWMDGEELFGQLTAAKGERFQYAQVYLNQAMDVHPPLFYLLVHTVFSLFPGKYSDGFLFAVNITALLLACVILWKTAGLFSNGRYWQGIAVTVFGTSQGFVSCALYFRMYAVFAFFATATFYLHLILEKEDFHTDKKLSRLLVGTIVLGFYTHYYFIIFLFPVFVITVIKMAAARKKREIISYISKMGAAGIISLFIWPFSVYHILFGYRGTEAVSNLTAGGLLTRIRNYYGIVSQAFFYNSGLLFLVVLLVACGVLAMSLRTKTVGQLVGSPAAEALVVCIFYMLIMSQIAPAQSDRYIMCLYPMIALLIGALYVKIAEMAAKGDQLRKSILAAFAAVSMIGSLCLISPNYLYLEQRDGKLGVGQETGQLNCLMIADDDWRGFSEALKMSRFGQVLVLGEGEIPLLEEEKPKNLGQDTVVYLLEELEQKRNLQETCRLLGYQFGLVEEVSSDIENFRAYLLRAGA